MIRSLVSVAALAAAALSAGPLLAQEAMPPPAAPAPQQAAPSPADATPGATATPLTASEKSFLIDAAKGTMIEVRIGQLAQDKAANPDVKNLGKTLVDDYTRMGARINQLAANAGVTLPTDLDWMQRRTIDKLSKESGARLDKDLTTNSVNDQKKDLSLFEKTAKNAKTPDVKNFAANGVPELKGKLKLAQDAQDKVKNEK